MSIFRQARTIYLALRDDATSQAKIQQELSTLALAIATDPNASMKITSATVNGQTFSGQQTMTQAERMQMLSMVVKMFKTGTVPTSEVIAIF